MPWPDLELLPPPWKPRLIYRLLHPFTWRRTQAAALALLPPQKIPDAVLAGEQWIVAGERAGIPRRP